MTKEEFLIKYGDVEVTFSEYYKYTFTFCADLPGGLNVSVGYGGDAGEIYRYSLSSGSRFRLRDVDPYTGTVCKDGVKVESFYDYC